MFLLLNLQVLVSESTGTDFYKQLPGHVLSKKGFWKFLQNLKLPAIKFFV